MKLVKSNRPKTSTKGKEFNELISEISTKGTVQEREQVVINNLKAKGLI
jgi:hypothetical protein